MNKSVRSESQSAAPGKQAQVKKIIHFWINLWLLCIYINILNFLFQFNGQNTLFGLWNWTEANRKHVVFGVSEFKSLMPDNMENLDQIVGQPYHVLKYCVDEDELCSILPARKDHGRKTFPPPPQGKEKLLFRLLAMMHPRPFLKMRFHPRGTVACVQAYNDKYVHIVFRYAGMCLVWHVLTCQMNIRLGRGLCCT